MQGSTPRPRSVAVALWIIIATSAVGAITFVARLVSAHWPTGVHPLSAALAWAILVVVFALLAGLIAALAFRRRWAWWVWLVLFVLGVPSEWSGLWHAMEQGGLDAARYVLLLALAVTAQILLLLRPARQWYGVVRRPREPSPPSGEWRPDPGGGHQYRYWEGERWTEHVADGGVAGVDPLPEEWYGFGRPPAPGPRRPGASGAPTPAADTSTATGTANAGRSTSQTEQSRALIRCRNRRVACP